jgi:hypothetical protein
MQMIAQCIRKISIASLVVGMLFLFSASAANATKKTSEGGSTKISTRGAAKMPKGTTVKVIPLGSRGIILSRRFRNCLSRASKFEQPAPPRDPRARCNGSVTVKGNVSVQIACKSGYLGGRASAMLAVNMKVTVEAYSQAMASGRAWAAARTSILSKFNGKAAVMVNCVRPPKETPPPPTYNPPSPSPSPTCEQLGNCPKYIVCTDGKIVDSPGSCVVQENNAKQHCEVDLRGDWNETKNTCTITQAQGNCSVIIVVNGDDNIISSDQNQLCNVNPPSRTPTCEERGDCPPANQIPVCVWYNPPQHVYPTMGFEVQVICQDPDGDAISVRVWSRRGQVTFMSMEGITLRYMYRAPGTVGDDTLYAQATDSFGARSILIESNFPNPYNER